jgi:hypothetical protein
MFFLAVRSRRMRAFFFELPHSRFRTFFVARYYHHLVEHLRQGNFGFLSTVTGDLTFFELGTFQEPEGWKETLSAWLETFDPPAMELIEFVDPGTGKVILTLRVGGRGASSGASVEDVAFFVLTIQEGMAVRGRFLREKAKALKAAGPSE